jgi:hypothetical protein
LGALLHGWWAPYLVPLVRAHQLLELFCQLDVVPEVGADALCPVQAHDHPQLEGPEAATQGQLPVLEVDYEARLGRLANQERFSFLLFFWVSYRLTHAKREGMLLG